MLRKKTAFILGLNWFWVGLFCLAFSGGVAARSSQRLFVPVTVLPATEETQVLINKMMEPALFKVVTYNIQHGKGTDGRVDLERVIWTLKEINPDLVILNEVDKNWHRSGNVDQAQWLAQALAYPYSFYAPNLRRKNENGEDLAYGNLLLSRYPIRGATNHPLPRFGLSEPRGLLEAVVMVNGSPLLVYGTHLGLNREERARQIEEIRAILSASPGPKILAGDFNTTPEEGELVPLIGEEEPLLYDAFALAGQENDYTYPAHQPTGRIDYLFVSKELAGKVHRVSTYPSQASDHLPVVMELVWHRVI